MHDEYDACSYVMHVICDTCMYGVCQDQRWHMTAECMRWLLRLHSLKRPIDKKPFLHWFSRYMWRISDGTARDIWYQIILWCKMPEFIVDATLEIDLDNTYAKPANLLFYKKRPGFPSGHNIREVLAIQLHYTYIHAC